jgi:CO dehydrogenase maturation factor
MLVISDPTLKGVKTARRISDLINELSLEVDESVLLINKVPDADVSALNNFAHSLMFKTVSYLPDDREIFRSDLEGRPVFDLSGDSKLITSLFSVFENLKIP